MTVIEHRVSARHFLRLFYDVPQLHLYQIFAFNNLRRT